MPFYPGNALASQGISPSGPIGGTDLNQALNPPHGVYGGLILGYVDFLDWYFDDDTGHEIGDGQSYAALSLSYVYGAKIFGGTVSSSIMAGYEDLTFGFKEQNRYYDDSGAMDIYTDIFFWSRFFPSRAFLSQPETSAIPYGLGVGGGLGVTWPTGAYDEDSNYNVGSNFYTLSPSIALTWTVPSLFGKALGDATQFSTRVFYNYYTENEDADFRNGAILSMDYSVTQIAGPFQYGIAGLIYRQVADDDFTGPKSAGRTENKAKSMAIGPVAQYSFTAQGRPWTAKLKTGKVFYARNAATTYSAVLTLGTSF